MENERSAIIKIGDKEYELLLTTKATKEINEKFGGLENVGNKLTKTTSISESLDIIVWLIVLLANQSILRKNLLEKKNDALLTVEMVEVFTSPADLNTFANAIMEALVKGTKRDIESVDEGKNAGVE